MKFGLTNRYCESVGTVWHDRIKIRTNHRKGVSIKGQVDPVVDTVVHEANKMRFPFLQRGHGVVSTLI